MPIRTAARPAMHTVNDGCWRPATSIAGKVPSISVKTAQYARRVRHKIASCTGRINATFIPCLAIVNGDAVHETVIPLSALFA